MQTAKGKLVNKDSNESLRFSLNPTEMRIARQFDFHVERCHAQNAPMVAYKGGSPATLSFQLRFDRDADKDCNVKTVNNFFRAMHTVNGKKSVPKLDFHMGSLRFTGYPSQLSMQIHRFDDHGEPTSLVVDMTILSSGDYENGLG